MHYHDYIVAISFHLFYRRVCSYKSQSLSGSRSWLCKSFYECRYSISYSENVASFDCKKKAVVFSFGKFRNLSYRINKIRKSVIDFKTKWLLSSFVVFNRVCTRDTITEVIKCSKYTIHRWLPRNFFVNYLLKSYWSR